MLPPLAHHRSELCELLLSSLPSGIKTFWSLYWYGHTHMSNHEIYISTFHAIQFGSSSRVTNENKMTTEHCNFTEYSSTDLSKTLSIQNIYQIKSLVLGCSRLQLVLYHLTCAHKLGPGLIHCTKFKFSRIRKHDG